MLGLLKRYIEEGMEDETVELKKSYHPGEATREIVAMANAGRGGYILHGVVDAKDRKTGTSFTISQKKHFANTDVAERQLRQYIKERVTPIPPFRVHCFEWTNGDIIGVIVVGHANAVHEFVREAQDRAGKSIAGPGVFLIRDGVEIRPMTGAEIARAQSTETNPTPGQYVDVINFGHVLTTDQIKQLHELGYRIGIPNLGESVHLDNFSELGPQVERILDSFGYSKSQWEECGTKTLFVLPGHPDIAAAFISRLHGRMGHFPRIIRRARGTDGAYHVVEVVDLQRLRDEQRAKIQSYG